jgi:hypothetical protein
MANTAALFMKKLLGWSKKGLESWKVCWDNLWRAPDPALASLKTHKFDSFTSKKWRVPRWGFATQRFPFHHLPPPTTSLANQAHDWKRCCNARVGCIKIAIAEAPARDKTRGRGWFSGRVRTTPQHRRERETRKWVRRRMACRVWIKWLICIETNAAAGWKSGLWWRRQAKRKLLHFMCTRLLPNILCDKRKSEILIFSLTEHQYVPALLQLVTLSFRRLPLQKGTHLQSYFCGA